MKVIYAGTGLLVLLALWAFWLAVQLIPTDLGNSYMIAASVLFSTAMLMVGLATIGRSIINEIRDLELAGPSPAVAPLPGRPQVSAVSPEPVMPVAPSPPVRSPAVPNALSAPALASVAAGVAAGAALGGAMRLSAEPVSDMKILDDLERDLFAELKAPSSPVAPVLAEPAPGKPEPAFEDALFADRVPQPAPAEPMPTLAIEDEPEDSALSRPSRAAAGDTGEDDDLMLPPLPVIPGFELPPLPELPPLALDEPIRAAEDAAHDDDDIDDRAGPEPIAEPALEAPMPEPEPVPASATPGLIHDEDFARLSEAEADLAPLETLDVVGAYDSGGTRFTMYSDGSVTAKGEGVDRRFRSLDDLRAFIDGGMQG